MQIGSEINDFLKYCAIERRLSENTLQAYACDLADFRTWLDASGTTEISTDALKAYLQAMVAERKLAAATVRRRVACLRAFFRHAADVGAYPDPFSGWRLALPRRNRRLPRALSRGEVTSLLSGPANPPSVFALEGQLETAVRLMIATGLRVGELCKLRVEDISPDGASLRVHGKGSRDRVAYLADLAFQAELRALVERRRRIGGSISPLFVNRHGSKLKPHSIRTKLHRAAASAGLARRITPHMLRHTAATLLIENGVDIRIVQRLLGHSSIATTELYTHVSDEALRMTLKRANVLQSLAIE
jgi:site-specific recombinase XerD